MTEDRQTKKPMASAIRAFVTGMKFPTDEDSSLLAMFTIAMLQFALGVPEGCSSVSASPSNSQIAELIHCSVPTVKRRLKALRDLGLMKSKRRGQVSSLHTFYQTPRSEGSTSEPSAAGSPREPSESVSGIKPPVQTDQAGGSVGSQSRSVGSPVEPLWGKTSGSSLEKPSLEKDAVGDKKGSPLTGKVSISDLRKDESGRWIYDGEAR